MGQGLGRNSPVQLTLGKDNYEALIERHGQWIRWRIASKCSCVSLPSMQPDIHCQICNGFGYTYTYQQNQVRFTSVMLYDNRVGVLTLNEEFEDYELIKVYDFSGKEYSLAEKFGCFIHLNDNELPIKGTYFNVILEKNNVSEINEAIVFESDHGYFRVPGLRNSKPNIEGVYYTSPSDIVEIEKIIDSEGVEYIPEEFRLDMFRITPKLETIEDENGNLIEQEKPITLPLTVKGIKFIKPFIFALLNQNLSKADLQAVTDYQGDAIVTFPYGCDVSNDDILTVLAGSYTIKEVNPRTEYETDTLGAYFVYGIINCSIIRNNEIINLIEGEDYILVGTNKIKWLDTENCPDVGDSYSITYSVLPTYKVVKQLPQIRTSENQRFPKKAVIKLHTTYAEKRGVNLQITDRKGIDNLF